MKIEINQKFQIAQQSITAIYDVLEDNKDFADIEYWIANETISNNENYLNLIYKIHKQKDYVTKSLNHLTELIGDLEIFINQCKNLILIEVKKDKKLEKKYNKYHSKN